MVDVYNYMTNRGRDGYKIISGMTLIHKYNYVTENGRVACEDEDMPVVRKVSKPNSPLYDRNGYMIED